MTICVRTSWAKPNEISQTKDANQYSKKSSAVWKTRFPMLHNKQDLAIQELKEQIGELMQKIDAKESKVTTSKRKGCIDKHCF